MILFITFGCLLSQSNDKDKYLYYFFSKQDVKDLQDQGTPYKPMYVIMDKDTLEVTQITENGSPFKDTNPKLLCLGIPEKTNYTSGGLYIHLKQFIRMSQ